jgi:CO/xanthine dehydrogenase FAD-binding subunit
MDLNSVEQVLAGPRALDRRDWAEGDAFLAGGTWLFSEPQPRLRRLRDLTTAGWAPLHVTPEGLSIAATCTLEQLAQFTPPRRWPALDLLGPSCDALLGSFKVARMATVGGNLCLALPAGPMTALIPALDGRCVLWSADGTRRELAAIDFVTGERSNALERAELLRSVELPAAALTGRTAFRRLSLHALGRSAVLVIGRRDESGSTVLTVTAATMRPIQLRWPHPPAENEVRLSLAATEPTWNTDVHGLPAWREHMTGLLLEEVRQELAR